MVLSYTPGRNFPSSQNKKNPFFCPSLKNNDKKKSALKKFLIFLKKAFLTFQESELSNIFLKKFFLFFWKWNFLALRIKISGRNFRARKIKKHWQNFLYMGKWNFLAINWKSSYISGGNWQCLKIKQKNLLQRDFLFLTFLQSLLW